MQTDQDLKQQLSAIVQEMDSFLLEINKEGDQLIAV
jgi:hypothetical protein